MSLDDDAVSLFYLNPSTLTQLNRLTNDDHIPLYARRISPISTFPRNVSVGQKYKSTPR